MDSPTPREPATAAQGAEGPRLEFPGVHAEPRALIDYILQRFHAVHRAQLPELIELAHKVETVHADHAQAPRGLAALLKGVHADLLDHMNSEETLLFPMLARGRAAFALHPICVMVSEHEEHGRKLERLLALTGQATAPEGACRSWVRLCAATRQFAEDLRRHIELENQVLFARFDPSLARDGAAGAA